MASEFPPKGQSLIMMDIAAKLREADLYRSMGLLSEALDVFEMLLSGLPDDASGERESLSRKIEEVRKEIGDRDQAPGPEIDEKDLSILKNDGTGHFTDLSDTLDLPEIQNGRGVAAGDVDGDGDLDLLILCFGEKNILLRRI